MEARRTLPWGLSRGKYRPLAGVRAEARKGQRVAPPLPAVHGGRKEGQATGRPATVSRCPDRAAGARWRDGLRHREGWRDPSRRGEGNASSGSPEAGRKYTCVVCCRVRGAGLLEYAGPEREEVGTAVVERGSTTSGFLQFRPGSEGARSDRGPAPQHANTLVRFNFRATWVFLHRDNWSFHLKLP